MDPCCHGVLRSMCAWLCHEWSLSEAHSQYVSKLFQVFSETNLFDLGMKELSMVVTAIWSSFLRFRCRQWTSLPFSVVSFDFVEVMRNLRSRPFGSGLSWAVIWKNTLMSRNHCIPGYHQRKSKRYLFPQFAILRISGKRITVGPLSGQTMSTHHHHHHIVNMNAVTIDADLRFLKARCMAILLPCVPSISFNKQEKILRLRSRAGCMESVMLSWRDSWFLPA